MSAAGTAGSVTATSEARAGAGTQAPLRRLAAWNAVSWAALAAYALVSSAVVFRSAGPEAYGLWATIVAFRGFVTFLDGGLAMGVTRDAALERSEHHDARPRLAAARRIYAALGVLIIALGLIGSEFPGSLIGLSGEAAQTARAVTIVLAIDAAIALLASPLGSILRGLQRFDVLAAGATSQAVVGSALVLALTAGWGVLGAAVASLLARILVTLVYVAWLHRHHRDLLGDAGGRAGIRPVVGFAIPLWAMAAGAQIGIGTDVPIVGGFYGAAAASHYAVGALVPAMAAGLLFVLIDTAFPRLAGASRDDLGQLIRYMSLGGCLLAGLGFLTIVLLGSEVLTVWVGSTPPLGLQVMAVYSLAWALNVPAHVLIVTSVAQGRHTILAPIVLAEALLSVALSVVLAATVGPLGPALATLGMLAVSNLVVIPLVVLRRIRVPWQSLLGVAVLGYAVGAAAALLVWALVSVVPGPALTRLVVGSGLTACVAGALLYAVFRPRRLLALVRDGGWRVLLRERAEARAARDHLATERRIHPIVWERSAPPLVTVRIATYNRGPLVAERAIASALEQTHRNLEVVVVGDACDAATERAVLSVRDPRVRFENLARRGDYPADPMRRWMVAGVTPMNRALELARGEWIAPLDDDDEFTPDHVEVLLDACRSRDLEFAYGVAESEATPGVWRPIGSWPPRHMAIVHAAVLYSARLRIFPHSIDSWRVHEPADWNLWKRMKKAGVRMGFVDRVVCRHFLERRETIRVPAPRPSAVGISS